MARPRVRRGPTGALYEAAGLHEEAVAEYRRKERKVVKEGSKVTGVFFWLFLLSLLGNAFMLGRGCF